MSELHPEDQVKLDTWYAAMMLLDHYRELHRNPMYERGRRWWASAVDRDIRATKLRGL
jgi:hypothetical protein